MKNKELFTLDPVQVNLKNEGVAKIRAINEKSGDANDLSIAKYELRTFVCEGEYLNGLKKMLETYIDSLQNDGKTHMPAFWVSGFYGSGKSHLVKMASYLWNDFKFPDGMTARSIKPLPQEIKDLFAELDIIQKKHGKLSIAGTLRDFPSKDIRYSFLQLLLNNLGLPPQYHHFKFVHWATQEKIYDDLKALVEASGKNFMNEVENLFVSTVLAKSVLQLIPDMAENEMKVKEIFKAQFPRVDSIGREDFVKTIKEQILPLSFGDKIPCTIIVLDEVQQFIGKDYDLADNVQFLAEDICSRFDSKFLLVGTGQNALTDTPILNKLMARFRVPIQLTNTDIQTVIRKTILDKKPTATSPLNQKLDICLGEISRNLEGTKYGYRNDDKSTLVADYPLMPSTRKFWYDVLQVVDVAGTSGQLRNQLRLIDDGLKFIAEKDLGCIIPADFIFTQTRGDMIQAGLLLNETSNLIQGKKAEGGDLELEGRILSVVFLLDHLTASISNTQLKSNTDTIADLLVDDLNNNSSTFRTKVKDLISKLVAEKVLMPINDEYKLQTRIGAEWEQEFTKQYIKLNSAGDDKIQEQRRERIIAHIKEKTKGINITQGNSRIVREFELWDKETTPNTEYKLNLWIRDGWYESQTTIENEIRAAGNNTPLAYAFIKKLRDAELKAEIIKYLAAGLTINAKGLPSTPEGEQAKRSMETRQSQAKTTMLELIEKICEETTILLAGGNTVQVGTLKENIQEALNSIADRQFPDFRNKADNPNWGQTLTRALAGNPDALGAINYHGDVEGHPVSVELLRFIGNNSKTGRDIRNNFMKSPYGWPQDAIDTMLIMLKNMQHISTNETDLKVVKINQATFKKEAHILSAKDKIAIRKLFQDAQITCPPNQEIFPYTNEYLNKLKLLASQVSGDAPRPEPININFIREIESKEGNERILEILQQKVDLQTKIKDWSDKVNLVNKREPQWNQLTELLNHAPDEPDLEQIRTETEAILENRLLLNEPDKIQPILQTVTEKLLLILNNKKQQYLDLYSQLMSSLQAHDYFKKLTPEQKHTILAKHQLIHKIEIKSLDSTTLLNQLNYASLFTWNTKIAALPGQFQSALEEAVLIAAPESKTYELPRKTITSQEEIDAYVSDLKEELEKLLKQSNSIMLR